MANTTFQLRRSSVAGKAPNTSTLSTGELALNVTDRKLYSSDGSNIFETGANLTTLSVANLTVTGITVNSSILSVNTAISANGSNGTAGQVLTTNSTGVYWSTVTGGGGSVDVAAQYTWTNTQTFQNTITFSSTINGTANNANNLGGTSASSYQLNSTLSDNVATLTANNTSYVGSVTAANVVSNAQLSGNLSSYQTTAGMSSYQTTAGLSANVATLTANNASYLGTVAAASYQLNSTLSANVEKLTANAAGYLNGKTEANLNVNNALTANDSAYLGGTIASGYQTTAGLSTAVSTLNANNAGYLGGVIAGAYLSNTGDYTISGVHRHIANVSVNGAFFASGSNGEVGQVLTSNGSSNVYWSTILTTIPASYVQNTDSRVLSGNLEFTGTNVYFTTAAYIGSVTVANLTGVWTTGTVNAATHSVGSGFVANTTVLNTNTDLSLTVNNKQLRFATLNATAYSYFINQNDDNFVFYTTNTAYGARPVFSIYANSITSNLNFSVRTVHSGGLQIPTGVTLIDSTGSQGTVGQVLTSNGVSNVYWSTFTPNIPASYVQNTDSRVLSGNLNFTATNNYFSSQLWVGANVLLTTGALKVGNTTFYSNLIYSELSLINPTNQSSLTTSQLSLYYPTTAKYANVSVNEISVGNSVTYSILSPSGSLVLFNQRVTTSFPTQINMYNINDSAGTYPAITLNKGRITGSGNTKSGDILGDITFYGSDNSGAPGSGGVSGALIRAQQEAEYVTSTGTVATRLTFTTSDNAGNTLERLRISSNGNIGIGNTTPADLLSVSGTSYFSGNSKFGNSTIFTVLGSDYYPPLGSGYSQLFIQNFSPVGQKRGVDLFDTSDSSDSYQYISFNKARIASHGSTQAGDILGQIDFNGSDDGADPGVGGLGYLPGANIKAKQEANYTAGAVGVATTLSFWTSNAATSGQNTYERLSITSNGNIGINNTAPTNKLSVNGTTYLGGNLILGSSSVAVGLQANGGYGSAGQVLTSNGSAPYWSTVTAPSVAVISYRVTSSSDSINATTDNLILANSASPITLTLPTLALSNGYTYTVKNINTGAVTVAASGSELIDGYSNLVIQYKYSTVGFLSTSSGWIIV